jgi:hypothetical protein
MLPPLSDHVWPTEGLRCNDACPLDVRLGNELAVAENENGIPAGVMQS